MIIILPKQINNAPSHFLTAQLYSVHGGGRKGPGGGGQVDGETDGCSLG